MTVEWGLELMSPRGGNEVNPEHEALLKLANTKMPFGKYAGRHLVDLPETYVLWFRQKGFPEGELGVQFETLLEIKVNGLESLIRPLIKSPTYTWNDR